LWVEGVCRRIVPGEKQKQKVGHVVPEVEDYRTRLKLGRDVKYSFAKHGKKNLHMAVVT